MKKINQVENKFFILVAFAFSIPSKIFAITNINSLDYLQLAYGPNPAETKMTFLEAIFKILLILALPIIILIIVIVGFLFYVKKKKHQHKSNAKKDSQNRPT